MGIENKLAKPVVEIIEHIAQNVPKGLGHGHHRIAAATEKAAGHFEGVEKDLAGKAAHHPPAGHVPHEGGSTAAPGPGGAGGKPPGGGKPPTGGGGNGAPHEPAGEDDAARAAREETERKAAEETERRIAALRTQGHAPGRHLDPDIETLQRRLGTTVREENGRPKIKQGGPNVGHVASEDHIDPLTGTTTDGDHGGVHRCGPYATKFNDPADMAKVDAYVRSYIDEHGAEPPSIPIADVLGPEGHKRLTGVYKDPENPDRYLPVDFEGGTIRAGYRQQPNGEWKAITMFPDPRPGRHP